MTPQELKICRKALGLTAGDLARQFNVNRRTVQRWEFNNTPPTEVEEWVKNRLYLYSHKISAAVDVAREAGEIELIRYATSEECLPATGMTVGERDTLIGHCVMALTADDLPYQIISRPGW